MKAIDVFIAAAAIALMAVLAVGLLIWGYLDETDREGQPDAAGEGRGA